MGRGRVEERVLVVVVVPRLLHLVLLPPEPVQVRLLEAVLVLPLLRPQVRRQLLRPLLPLLKEHGVARRALLLLGDQLTLTGLGQASLPVRAPGVHTSGLGRLLVVDPLGLSGLLLMLTLLATLRLGLLLRLDGFLVLPLSLALRVLPRGHGFLLLALPLLPDGLLLLLRLLALALALLLNGLLLMPPVLLRGLLLRLPLLALRLLVSLLLLLFLLLLLLLRLLVFLLVLVLAVAMALREGHAAAAGQRERADRRRQDQAIQESITH